MPFFFGTKNNRIKRKVWRGEVSTDGSQAWLLFRRRSHRWGLTSKRSLCRALPRSPIPSGSPCTVAIRSQKQIQRRGTILKKWRRGLDSPSSRQFFFFPFSFFTQVLSLESLELHFVCPLLREGRALQGGRMLSLDNGEFYSSKKKKKKKKIVTVIPLVRGCKTLFSEVGRGEGC